jgi:hypothetical protein
MTLNPQSSTVRDERITGIEGGTVTIVKSHDPNSDDRSHVCWVSPDSFEGDVRAEILVPSHGTVTMPEEGDRVLVIHRRDDQPMILGERYEEFEDVPAYDPGERRDSHPASDAYVRYRTDDTLVLAAHDGNSDLKDTKPDLDVQSDDAIVINPSGQYKDVRLKDDGRLAVNLDGATSHIDLKDSDSAAVNWTGDDTDVRLKNDGRIVINYTNGKLFEIDPTTGEVTIDEGTNNPVTDVSTTTDSDGHVTSISLTKSLDVYVP